ncbi:MAG: amidohydrolase family protein [Conexibacteraceae bacterium]|nr:amidohydrolase family protein [Conexibacteraceae bacterium]
MRIDAHHHVWDLEVRDQPWTAGIPALRRSFTLEDLEPALRRHAIDATVLVQTVCVAQETPELLALAAAEPVIAGVVGWVDLTAPDVSDAIAALRESPGGERLVGIRHQVQEEPDHRFLVRADVRRGLRAVAEAGLVYDLLVRPHQLPAAVTAVQAVPELRFVLDHAGKPVLDGPPSAKWPAAIDGLAARPNVTVKLSGLTSEAPAGWNEEMLAPFVERLLTRFGPERMMFGSDWPVCLLGGGYDRTIAAAEALTAELAPHERDLVFGEVAMSVYGLGR